MKLKGKTALITGGAKRLGRATALELARGGASIVVHYNRSLSEARATCREIEKLGVEARAVKARFDGLNGKTVAAVKAFSKEVYRHVPAVDILINNASIFYPTPLGKVTEKDWDAFMNVNLKLPFFLAQEFGTRMKKKRRGVIVNLLDWTATRPYANYLPYAASKAGLQSLTAGLAKALAPQVRVNGVAPGPILKAEGASAAQNKRVRDKTVLKRFGNPQDIAATVRFLCEGSDFITGAVIPVEGGSLL